MSRSIFVVALLGLVSLVGLMQPVEAQFAVIDVSAIAQLVQQVSLLQQQLANAERQLTEAQQQLQSMTGPRGMQNLLSGLNRNYLPVSFSAIPSQLAGPIQRQVGTNAVLTPAQVAALSPAEQAQLSAARGNAALLQVTTQDAYATTSARFASIQQLINAIPTATDQKGILELQARIEAELGMLANEATKLNVLYQAAVGEEWARRQSASEQAVTGIGSLRTLAPLQLP
jgi:type IV secretion system protein VirB5